MKFTAWKTKYGIEEGLFMYSLRLGTKDIPIILDQERFIGLFPKVNPEDIPEAPNTTFLKVTALVEPE